MKPKEAIEIIKDHFPSRAMKELCEALNIAIASTEKQIPAKMNFVTGCIKCGYLWADHVYCPECGQKLDWEE